MRLETIFMGTLTALGLSATSLVAQEHVLRIAIDSPSTGNVCSGYVDVWARRVEEASGGRLGFELMCDGLLGRVGDTVTRVEAGVADIGWDLPLSYGARFAPLGVIGVPGLYDDANVEHASAALWRLQASGQSGVDFGSNLKLLWVQAVPNTAYYLRAAPPSNTDLSGLRIAMGSRMRAVMISAVGGIPVRLSPPEYYQALVRGAADGAQSTVGAIAAYQLNELTHHYIYGQFGGGFTFIVMNQASYDRLPADLQAILDEHTGEGMSRWAANYLYNFENNFLRDRMLSVPGNVRVDLTPEETAAWGPAFAAAAADWAETVENGEQLLATYRALLAEVIAE